ncbi:cellulase family glycosylhydrolase [Streptomyces sp. NPDC059740]|uniref:cellulase family glycosylhydrolase n=1 Tax=Streptomyces sp. NPDC059740 TaxID=3346926 RepID=UPI00364A4E76
MRKRLAALVTAFLATAATFGVTAAPPARAEAPPGFHISDGRLLDADGHDFVMRGVNQAHAWYRSSTPRALQDIRALGANTVRIVLGTGDRWAADDAADVAAVVAQCKENRLVCVLEAHDTTGFGEQAGAVSLDRAADYWISVASAIRGQEKYVVLNIGNEPYGNTGYGSWAADTSAAVNKLRAAGFHNTLMVDAPNWGQDWSFTMRDNAGSVFAADPERNTLFSVHMYGVFDTAAEVNDYLNRFADAKLPLVVGEFGDRHTDGDPDEDAIMSATRQLGVGYLGWSWSGNGQDVAYLDMATDFDASRLTAWGQRIFQGPDGIQETAREAGVHGTAPSAARPVTAG